MLTTTLILDHPVIDHSNDTFEAIVMKNGLKHRPLIVPSTSRLFKRYADASNTLKEMSNALAASLKKHQHLTFVPPKVELAGADVAALGYDAAAAELEKRLTRAVASLREGLRQSGAGVLEWTGPGSARFGYYTHDRTTTALETRTYRIRHTHELSRARSWALDTKGIQKPKEVEALIAELPESVRRCCKIATGDLILATTQECGVSIERRPVAKAMDAVSSHLTETGKSLGPAILHGSLAAKETTGNVLSRGWNFLKSAARQVFLDDPAVVFANEFVLFGWVDEKK